MTTWVNSQFPRPDFHRQVQQHYGLQYRPRPWCTKPTSGWLTRIESSAWDSRGHFFAAAAEAMRRILVDRARRKRTDKHGGQHQRQDLDDVEIVAAAPSEDLVALDEALTRLAAEDPAKAELVKLRYFAGLSIEESARALGISSATAKRRWAFARAWLFHQIEGAGP